MSGTDREISTQLIVILLVPVVLVFGLLGYVIIDSLTISQPPDSGPDAVADIEDHPDRLNRSSSGEGIVRGRLEGEETVNWSDLVFEVIDPRSETVIAAFSKSGWAAEGAGQSIQLQTNGTPPTTDETLLPGERFVIRDAHDDPDDSDDIINPCASYVFRLRHTPSETVLGTFETTFVSADWVPGTSCDDTNG